MRRLKSGDVGAARPADEKKDEKKLAAKKPGALVRDGEGSGLDAASTDQAEKKAGQDSAAPQDRFDREVAKDKLAEKHDKVAGNSEKKEAVDAHGRLALVDEESKSSGKHDFDGSKRKSGLPGPPPTEIAGEGKAGANFTFQSKAQLNESLPAKQSLGRSFQKPAAGRLAGTFPPR